MLCQPALDSFLHLKHKYSQFDNSNNDRQIQMPRGLGQLLRAEALWSKILSRPYVELPHDAVAVAARSCQKRHSRVYLDIATTRRTQQSRTNSIYGYVHRVCSALTLYVLDLTKPERIAMPDWFPVPISCQEPGCAQWLTISRDGAMGSGNVRCHATTCSVDQFCSPDPSLSLVFAPQILLQHNLTVHSFQIIEWNFHETIQITLPPKLEMISLGMYHKGNG